MPNGVQPGAAHRELAAALLGEWRGEERLVPMPWDPAGGSAVAHVRSAPALGGLAVVQEYEQLRGGRVTLRGLGVFRWDPAAEEVVLAWLDSLSPEPREFRGAFEGPRLVLVSRAARGHARSTYDFSAPDAYRHRLEVSRDGGGWEVCMEGEYGRE
jgi:hypothetical protein